MQGTLRNNTLKGVYSGKGDLAEMANLVWSTVLSLNAYNLHVRCFVYTTSEIDEHLYTSEGKTVACLSLQVEFMAPLRFEPKPCISLF